MPEVAGCTEAPLAWHDESPERDGTIACAFRTDSLIRVDSGVGADLPFADITRLEAVGAEYEGGLVITSTGRDGTAITCTFAEEEGGSRFLRQLEVETGLTTISSPAP